MNSSPIRPTLQDGNVFIGHVPTLHGSQLDNLVSKLLNPGSGDPDAPPFTRRGFDTHVNFGGRPAQKGENRYIVIDLYIGLSSLGNVKDLTANQVVELLSMEIPDRQQDSQNQKYFLELAKILAKPNSSYIPVAMLTSVANVVELTQELLRSCGPITSIVVSDSLETLGLACIGTLDKT